MQKKVRRKSESQIKFLKEKSVILFKMPDEAIYTCGQRSERCIYILLFGRCKMKLDDKNFPSRDLETRLAQNPRNSIGRGKKEGSEGFAFADPNITFRKQGVDA